MRKSALQKIAEAMRDETGGQSVKSAVGMLFFFAFVASGVLINSASLPLSYNIAFGDSGNGGGGQGSGSGGGGGGSGGSGGGTFSQRTKARIDDVRVMVHFDGQYADSAVKGSGTNDASTGLREWALPEQGTIRDNRRTIAELPFGETSHFLRIDTLRLEMPQTAKITGITLEIERSADGPNMIRDYSVRLMKNGRIAGKEMADQAAWPAADSINTYGNEKEMWGMDLTPQEAMSADFGVMIAATNGADSAVPIRQTITESVQKMPWGEEEDIAALITIVRGKPKKTDIVRLQSALIGKNAGPAAKKLAGFGPTGIYGKVTREAMAEFEALITQSAPQPTPIPSTGEIAPMPIPMYSPNIALGTQGMPQAPESGADMLLQVVSIKAPLIRGNENEDVRTLQNLLMRWNIGPMARELAKNGATGIYGIETERAVVELQRSIMKNKTWPKAKALIDAFRTGKYALGSFGLATQAAEIEYLQNTIAGGR